MHASARHASLLILSLVIAGCGTATSPSASAPSSALASSPASSMAASPTQAASPSPSGAQVATTASVTPPATGSQDPSDGQRQHGDAVLATLRDPKLAVEFRISGTQAMSGTTLTSSGSLIVAGPDIELALVTDELSLRVGEVAKGGKVWLRVGDGRWLLDESPTRPPAVASAFAKAVAVDSPGSVLLDAVKLDRVHLSGVDLDALLMAMGMADPGTTGSTGDAYLLLAQDGSFAGIQLDVSYVAAAGQERQTIWRTLAVVRLAQVGQTGSPTVATPQDAWIRHYSKRLAYLVNYPPTMRQSEPAEGDSYKGPSSAQCLITGSVIGSKDTLASITKAEVTRLTKGGITVAANRAAKVAGDPAQRLELKFQSAGKAYWAVKYIVVHQNVVYTLSWMDLAGRRTALEKVATEMLASFQPVF